MGFRNPITSASDLDTRSTPSGAGVVITGPRATWQDAVGGTGYIEVSSSGGGSISGSRFDMVGPLGPASGPSMVRHRLVDAPAGGYTSVLELDADSVVLGAGQLAHLVPKTALPLNTTYFGPLGTPYLGAFFWKDAGGVVHLQGTARINSTAFGINVVIGTLPAGCRPGQQLTFDPPGFNDRPVRLDVATNGQITWANVMAADTSAAVGGYFSFTGIFFLAEN